MKKGNDHDVQAQERMLIVNGDLKNNGLRLERDCEYSAGNNYLSHLHLLKAEVYTESKSPHLVSSKGNGKTEDGMSWNPWKKRFCNCILNIFLTDVILGIWHKPVKVKTRLEEKIYHRETLYSALLRPTVDMKWAHIHDDVKYVQQLSRIKVKTVGNKNKQEVSHISSYRNWREVPSWLTLPYILL